MTKIKQQVSNMNVNEATPKTDTTPKAANRTVYNSQKNETAYAPNNSNPMSESGKIVLSSDSQDARQPVKFDPKFQIHSEEVSVNSRKASGETPIKQKELIDNQHTEQSHESQGDLEEI